jgi:hypothetical protein
MALYPKMQTQHKRGSENYGEDMTHAIIRGKNGRRHEVDFGDAPVRVKVHASEEAVEIFVQPDFENSCRGASAACDSQHSTPSFQRGYRRSGATRIKERAMIFQLPGHNID